MGRRGKFKKAHNLGSRVYREKNNFPKREWYRLYKLGLADTTIAQITGHKQGDVRWWRNRRGLKGNPLSVSSRAGRKYFGKDCDYTQTCSDCIYRFCPCGGRNKAMCQYILITGKTRNCKAPINNYGFCEKKVVGDAAKNAMY